MRRVQRGARHNAVACRDHVVEAHLSIRERCREPRVPLQVAVEIHDLVGVRDVVVHEARAVQLLGEGDAPLAEERAVQAADHRGVLVRLHERVPVLTPLPE